MLPPKISVIVPVYNVEKYIDRCMDSILNQTMQEGLEVIIVNDCTPDGSMEKIFEALRAYKERTPEEKRMTVRVVVHDTNRGLASVRNTGIHYATGDYVIHADGDDWVNESMYDKLYRKAVTEDADVVVCDYWAEYNTKSIRHRQCTSCNKRVFISKLLSGELHNGMWNKLVRRSLYDRLDFLWTEGINMWEDVSVMCRIAYYAERISYVGEALYHYNQTNENAYTKVWKERSLENIVQATDIVCSFYGEKETEFRNDVELFKLRAKSTLLLHSPVKIQNRYKNLYPETDGLIFRHPALPVHHKVLIWCWCHSLSGLANALQAIIVIIKGMIRK